LHLWPCQPGKAWQALQSCVPFASLLLIMSHWINRLVEGQSSLLRTPEPHAPRKKASWFPSFPFHIKGTQFLPPLPLGPKWWAQLPWVNLPVKLLLCNSQNLQFIKSPVN
jgi:hypothetical protein